MGNCLVSRGLPSDAEQLPERLNFQFAPKNHYGFFFLHTLPSTSVFRLGCVLFYQYYLKIATSFDQEKFGTAPHVYVVVEKFGGNWLKNDVKMSKYRNRQTVVMDKSRLTPSHGRQHFLAPVRFNEIPVGYAWNCSASSVQGIHYLSRSLVRDARD